MSRLSDSAEGSLQALAASRQQAGGGRAGGRSETGALQTAGTGREQEEGGRGDDSKGNNGKGDKQWLMDGVET